MKVYSWENPRTKWWIFQQAMFDYQKSMLSYDFLMCSQIEDLTMKRQQLVTN